MDNRIRELRLERGLTLEQLAERAGTHFTTIGKLETGKMELTLKWLGRLAHALDVPITDMFQHENLNKPGQAPVIFLENGKTWDECLKFTNFDLKPSPKSFLAFLENYGEQNRMYLIDPSDRELEADGRYAYRVGRGEHYIGTYLEQPARFDPTQKFKVGESHFFGTDDILVTGRVHGFFVPMIDQQETKLMDFLSRAMPSDIR